MASGKWAVVILVFLSFAALLGFLLTTNDPGSMPVLPSLAATALPLTATPDSTPAPPTATPLPTRQLVICQGDEPNTLFIYGGPSRAARNVLEAIYDGPVDTRTYQFQPVILERLPSQDEGDIILRTIEVAQGAQVVDINGSVEELFPGVTVSNAAGQETTFEDGGVLTMTQMVVTFTLRTDVTWADGQPLTSDDFVYSFELAGEFDSPNLRFLLERTASYQAVDAYTLVWTGLPGYRDTWHSYLHFLNSYPPLPRHVWGEASADQLLNAEVAHRKPLGWGAFIVEEWVEGDRITLVRNPHYFRAGEGLPHLDRVTFRFVPDLDRALTMLTAGECDIIARDLIESKDVTPLLEAAGTGAAQLISSPSSEWEHLDFGIEPASWTNRPDFFGDVRVRQAIALCIDRERIAREAPAYGNAYVAQSYLAAEHPLYAGDWLYRWGYDPDRGRSMLDEVGWRDEDGDGIREAHGVTDVRAGIPFTVTLSTTSDDPARERTAAILTENLANCGIGMSVEYFPDQEFFADGPDGPVLGRKFDMALFSWLNGPDDPCWLYLSTEIPQSENWWTRSNDPGYASDEYDRACQAALDEMPGSGEYIRLHREAQRIFSRDLPALPLYFAPQLIVTRPEVSGVMLDPGEYTDFWNIETLDRTQMAR